MEVDADVMVVRAADTDYKQWNESGAGSSRKAGLILESHFSQQHVLQPCENT